MTDPKLEAPKPHGYCEKCSTASETVCHFYPDMCPDRAAIEPSPEPTKETKFWQSVRELAKLRYNIPAERRSISGAASLSDESPEEVVCRACGKLDSRTTLCPGCVDPMSHE